MGYTRRMFAARHSLLLLLLGLVACSPASNVSPPSSEPVVTAAPQPTQGEPIPTATVAVPDPPPRACTKIGCMSTLDVAIEDKPGQKGAYVIEVEAGDQKGLCEMKMPAPKCGEPWTRCEGTLPLMAKEGEICKQPAKDQMLAPLTIGVAPEKVTVRVLRDKKKVHEETVAPPYKTVQPNGPGCEPTCKQAEIKVTVGGAPPVRVRSDAEAITAATKCARDRKMKGVWKSELVFDKPTVNKVGEKWLVTFSEQTPKGKPQGAALFVTAAGGCEIAPQE
jgi:hypothetical protein